MGYYTWTLGNRKPERNSWGDYRPRCKLPYGGRGVIVCPDNRHIVEPHYEGYGIFDGHDAYDLVTDFNRDYLGDLFHDMARVNPDFWGHEFTEIAEAYQSQDDERLQDAIRKCAAHAGNSYPFWSPKEWKRHIGITLACEDEVVDILPYPLKIVDNIRIQPYEKLRRSYSCQ